MVKCPSCKKYVKEERKAWKYGKFNVKAYVCDCGTEFRDYSISGKYKFTLKHEKGRGYVKA